MKLGPYLLGRGAIHRLLKNDVTEREEVVGLAAQESTLQKRLEVRARSLCRGAVDERRDVVDAEVLADHGGALQHRALAGPEAIEPRREQSLDRLGQTAFGSSLERKRDELLEEQRVSLGGLDNPGSLVARERSSAEPVQNRAGLVLRKAVENDSSSFNDIGALHQQFFAREEQDEDRRRAPRRHADREVEEGRLRPLNVVEDEH